MFLAPSAAALKPGYKERIQEVRDRHKRTVLRAVTEGFKKQPEAGRHAHLEQPAGAASWTEGEFADRPGYDVVFDQCRLGAVMRDGSNQILGPARKRTRLMSTKKSLCGAFSKYQCQYSEGAHICVRGEAGTELQNYPTKMCRLLARQMSDDAETTNKAEFIETVEALDVKDGSKYDFNLAYQLVLDEPREEQGMVAKDGEKDLDGKEFSELLSDLRARFDLGTIRAVMKMVCWDILRRRLWQLNWS